MVDDITFKFIWVLIGIMIVVFYIQSRSDD
jgi:hypothetical protein